MSFHSRAPRRRPRRVNSLKDLRRLLSTAETSHKLSRAERFKWHAAKLSDTAGDARSNHFKIATINLFLRRYGVQFIVSEDERVFHIHEDHRGAIGAAWLDDGPAGRALRHLKDQAYDPGAPVPRPAQSARLGVSRWTGLQGGATDLEKRRATISRARLNAQIMKLRDADQSVLDECAAYERSCEILDALIPGHRKTPWEAMAEAAGRI